MVLEAGKMLESVIRTVPKLLRRSGPCASMRWLKLCATRPMPCGVSGWTDCGSGALKI
jgi:hypothetical protein